MQDLQQVDCQSGEIISLVIGSLGTITSWTNAELRKLKLCKHKEALQMTVIKGSVNILHHHLRRDDFERRKNGSIKRSHREINDS